MLTVLIDGDVIVYKAAFSAQDNVFSVIRDDDGHVINQYRYKKEANEMLELLELSGASYSIDKKVIPQGHDEVDGVVRRIIKRIVKDTKATDYTIYITGVGNFRKETATYLEYKANRKDVVKPIHYEYVRELLLTEYDAIIADHCEADDALAIHQTMSEDLTIISTIDKDLKTVPGLNHNIRTGDIIYVTQADANAFFAKQMLMGDSADNIPGISFYSDKKKRIGPKTAEKILGDASSTNDLYTLVSDTYRQYAGQDWHKKLQETSSLLWMQREPNQQFNIEDWKLNIYI